VTQDPSQTMKIIELIDQIKTTTKVNWIIEKMRSANPTSNNSIPTFDEDFLSFPFLINITNCTAKSADNNHIRSISLRGYGDDLNTSVELVKQQLEKKKSKCLIPVGNTSQGFIDFVTGICKRNNIKLEKDLSNPQRPIFVLTGHRKTLNKNISDLLQASQFNFEAVEFPIEWKALPDTPLQEIHTSRQSEEGKIIMDLFKETLPQNKITSIKRIQNTHLWKNYAFERKKMKDNGDATELLLFHGTRNNDPAMIYNGKEEGFDVRLAQAGAYGRGIYFAEAASYSHNYTYNQRNNGKCYFILALVLVGNSIGLAGNNALVRPPQIQGSDKRHDSVTNNANGNGVKKPCPSMPGSLYMGLRGTSSHYIVYNNNRAYPYYLIEYQ